MESSLRRPILVIGAGVAGTVCALRLRQLGVDVHLAERARFPRSKVCGCCIGGAGLSVLELVDLKDWILDRGQITRQWLGSLGGYRVEVPIESGVAISRESLDTELLSRVERMGTTIHAPVTALVDSIHQDRVTVTMNHANGESHQLDYEMVVLASGLNATGSNRLLPWIEVPHGPFGASFFADVDHLAPGVIAMACSAEGYVGAVRLEDDRVDVAAALTAGASAGTNGNPMIRILGILEQSELGLGKVEASSPIKVTPPLRRARLAGCGRLVAIGDASGYVEPFTGEGMTWGMMSGYELANLIALSADQLDQIGEKWCRHQRQLLGSRRRACRILTTVLQSSVARGGAGYLLSRIPSLTTPVTSHLSRPWRSPLLPQIKNR